MDHQVGGLYIAVHDTLFVGVIQSPQRLDSIGAGFLEGQAPLLAHDPCQGWAIDELHGHVVLGSHLEKLPNLRDIRVIDYSGVIGNLGPQTLKRHLAVQLYVNRVIHRPHSAFTQAMVDLVVLDDRVHSAEIRISRVALELGLD